MVAEVASALQQEQSSVKYAAKSLGPLRIRSWDISTESKYCQHCKGNAS
jgi:hypothetical protein